MALSAKTATVSVTAGNTTTIVAAVAGQSILVHAFVVCGSAAATTIVFKDTGGNSLSGTLLTAANGSIVAPYHNQGYFNAGSGQQLDITAGTGNVTGFVRFSQTGGN